MENRIRKNGLKRILFLKKAFKLYYKLRKSRKAFFFRFIFFNKLKNYNETYKKKKK